MLKKDLDYRVAECLYRLKAEEMRPLRAWLEASLSDTVNAVLDATSDVSVRQLQGEARLLRELLKLIETSRELAEKLKR